MARAWPGRAARVGVAWIVISSALTSCGPPVAEPIEVVAEDYRFTVPETVPAGSVAIKLVNQESRSHAVQLYRLNDGVTADA